MNTNDNPHDAPPELLAQAYRIALYFAERGIKNWSLGPVAKGFNATTNAARAGSLIGRHSPDINSINRATGMGAGRDLSEMLDEDEGIPRGKVAYPPTHSLSDDFKRDGGRQGD